MGEEALEEFLHALPEYTGNRNWFQAGSQVVEPGARVCGLFSSVPPGIQVQAEWQLPHVCCLAVGWSTGLSRPAMVKCSSTSYDIVCGGFQGWRVRVCGTCVLVPCAGIQIG